MSQIPVPVTKLANLLSKLQSKRSPMVNFWWGLAIWMLCAIVQHALADANSCSQEQVSSRHRFPPGFVFGTASSSFQYEGAVNEGGRGATIWDVLSHVPGKIEDGSNADIAVDQYHRLKEDTGIMKEMGIDAYRFSIAWSRIFPKGKGQQPNKEGIKYYNELIDSLLENGMQPYVTLSHSDLPLALQEDYGGWISSQIIDDFVNYANVCFTNFGDRVKNWITFNEPHLLTNGAYNVGVLPPNRCSPDVGICDSGNSSSEMYIVGHNFLLAHAAAVGLYRKHYQHQVGRIGITLDSRWFEPLTPLPRDIRASLRALDFELGWFMDPLIFGDYPRSMRRIVADRLPTFTTQQQLALKGSADFVGINHYTTNYASEASPQYQPPLQNMYEIAYYKDTKILLTGNRSREPIGPNINGQFVVPWGMHKLLGYIRSRYHNPLLIITENGVSDPQGANNTPLDKIRLNYIQEYLTCLSTSIREGSNVQGYFVWSLFDNWEWNRGYAISYGLYHIDRQNNLTRQAKASAVWYKRFLKRAELGAVMDI